MTKLSQDETFNFIGTTGGVILALALIPQIALAHKRRSAEDISYMWQAIYITGLATLMVYYAHFRLWAVFCPVALECSFLVYLTGLKMYFEKVSDGGGGTARTQQQSPPLEAAGSNGTPPGESTSINGIMESAVGAGRGSPKTSKYGGASAYERV